MFARGDAMNRKSGCRHHEFSFILILLAIVLFTGCYFVIRARANELGAGRPKLVTLHTVKEGENLTQLAMDYSDPVHYPNYHAYIREVKFTNHLSGDLLHPGQQIFLPYYR